MKPELEWRVCHPTDTTTATQLVIQGEVYALYWHRQDGFQRTAGRRVYSTENEIRKAIIAIALQRAFYLVELIRDENNHLKLGA